MTPAEALATIQALTRAGRVFLGDHALQRMEQRNIRRRDIDRGLLTATAATHQPERDRWKVTGGEDMDGDELTLVVEVHGLLLVVTVF